MEAMLIIQGEDDAANIEIGLLRERLLDARGVQSERVRKKELEAQVEDLKRDFEREEKPRMQSRQI